MVQLAATRWKTRRPMGMESLPAGWLTGGTTVGLEGLRVAPVGSCEKHGQSPVGGKRQRRSKVDDDSVAGAPAERTELGALGSFEHQPPVQAGSPGELLGALDQDLAVRLLLLV